MAIEIQEKFEIEAPIDRVWSFVTDPETVVPCLPGASLAEVVDDRNFLGKVKVKLGAVTAGYKGKIHFSKVDEENHVLEMVAEGKDPSGGTAKGTITVSLTALEGGHTEMITDASIDLTGKVMQVGRGMIKGVSHQLFLQFAKTAKTRLEEESHDDSSGSEDAGSAQGANATTSEASATQPPPAPVEEVPLKVLPLLLKTLWAGITGFFQRLFGGGAK
jgi:carbon monoxide dehydrogenase subunit G